MKLTENTLKELINEELKSDEALLRAIENLADKIEDLDISVDFLSAAFVGGDPLSIGGAQKSIGRAYRPSMRRMPEPLQREHAKITKATLKELVREELQSFLNEQEINKQGVRKMKAAKLAAREWIERQKEKWRREKKTTDDMAKLIYNKFSILGKGNAAKLAKGEALIAEEELETINEGLSRTDKDEIKTLISKELDKTLKKEVKKVLEDELSKALNSKANKEEIAEITKKVMKKLYKDLSYHHPYIIDRIKV